MPMWNCEHPVEVTNSSKWVHCAWWTLSKFAMQRFKIQNNGTRIETSWPICNDLHRESAELRFLHFLVQTKRWQMYLATLRCCSHTNSLNYLLKVINIWAQLKTYNLWRNLRRTNINKEPSELKQRVASKFCLMPSFLGYFMTMFCLNN